MRSTSAHVRRSHGVAWLFVLLATFGAACACVPVGREAGNSLPSVVAQTHPAWTFDGGG